VKSEKTWLGMIWEDRPKWLVLGLCLLLTVSIIAVYWQTVGFNFVDIDDQSDVVNNPMVPGGLTWAGIKWAFTTMYAGNWIPLVWLSLMLDRTLGAAAGGFHLVNVAFHIANTILLFWVLKRYSKAIWASFFVAALFALHPLHVESVAWVTERKDVLSMLFWMLTMLAYVRYVENPAAKRYAIVCVTFALGLMAKSMLVTLPLALLLMDYWPLKRLWPEEKSNGVTIGRLLFEKLPLLLLSAASCVITVIAQKSSGAVAKISIVPFNQRIGNAMVSYCQYLIKMFWPVDLAVFYPYPVNPVVDWKVAAAFAALLAITIVVILLRRRRYLLVGWFWYLGTLLPVIGFVQVGRQAMADRYTYIPLTGLFIMLVWLACDILSQWRHRWVIIGVAVSAIIGVLGAMTFVQVSYWRNTISLFTHTAAVTTDNYLAYSVLGACYAQNGDLERARSEIEKIMKVNVMEIDVLYNVAKCLDLTGRPDEAIGYYKRILAITPGEPYTYVAMATKESDRGNFERAMALYRDGLKYHPEDGELHGRFGTLLFQAGLVDEAAKELETAVKLKADSAIYVNFGAVMLTKGDVDKATKYFNMAIKIDPVNAEAHYNLGEIFLTQELFAKAVGEYETAIKAKPNYAKAHCHLGFAFAKMGQLDGAIKCFRRAIEYDPNNIEAQFDLAITLSDAGSIDEAVEYLRKVVKIIPRDTTARCRLAGMLLLQGKVEQATAEYEQVLKINPADGDARAGLEKIKTGNTTSGTTPVK
jgi:protein O-mannosyl-transferase